MFLNFLLTHTPLLYFVQSFWRDEAFSVLFAKHSIPFIVMKSSMEPPFYYTLLFFWVRIFGESEIAARSLSLLGMSLATVVAVLWSEKLFKKHFLSWVSPIFFFLNPMLLYYAFEVRAYGWYIFFSILSLYWYREKKWIPYTVAVVLGIYTHLYLGIIPFTQLIHYIITNKLWKKIRSFKDFVTDPMIRSLGVIGICFLPWAIRLTWELQRFKESWYYPVDLHLIKSVLGNMFLGYEGTPWYLWPYTTMVSLVLLAFFLFPLRQKKVRDDALYFLLLIFFPLILIIGISFIKPVFVNRYLIFVTIAQVFLLSYSLYSIKNKLMQYALTCLIFFGLVGFNLWYPKQHKKLDIRKTMMEVNALAKKDDTIYASDPIIFMETLYYAKDRSRVKLYNPKNSPFPWYIGDAIFLPSYNAQQFSVFPDKTFLVKPDLTFTTISTLNRK